MKENLKGRIGIVIPHCFSTVRIADRIAVIADGHVTELGSHEELLRAKAVTLNSSNGRPQAIVNGKGDRDFDTIRAMTRRNLLFVALGLAATCLAQDDGKARKTIKVTGKVNKPGEYELKDGLRVFDSLGLAGGFLDFADTRRVIIIRGSERRTFNYRNYLQGKRIEENILLMSGDVVLVN